MTNNDFFKKILHLTGLINEKETVVSIFNEKGTYKVTKSLVKSFIISDKNNYRRNEMTDEALNQFINNLFCYRDELFEKGVNTFFVQKFKIGEN